MTLVHRQRFVAAQARIAAMRTDATARWGRDFIDLGRSEPIAAWLSEPTQIERAWGASRRYMANGGIRWIRERVADHYGRECGIELEAGNVLIAPGGLSMLCTSFAALAGHGHEVVFAVPHYPQYPAQIELSGARPVAVATDESDPRLTPARLAAACGPRTQVIVLNNPTNPTGTLYSPAELEALLDAAPPDATWLVDEVYADYVLGSEARPNAASLLSARGGPWLVLRSASKTVGRPGLRTAVALGDPHSVARVEMMLAITAGGANTLGQAVLPAALAAARDIDISPYVARLEAAMIALREAGLDPLRPRGTYYLWVRHPRRTAIGTVASAETLAQETGVFVWPGEFYGDPRGLRLSISTPHADLVRGIERLAEGLTAAPEGIAA